MVKYTLSYCIVFFAFGFSKSINAQELSSKSLEENFRKLNRKSLVYKSSKSPRKSNRLALDSMCIKEVESGQVVYTDIFKYEYDLVLKTLFKKSRYYQEPGNSGYYGYFEKSFDESGNLIRQQDYEMEGGKLKLKHQDIFLYKNNRLLETLNYQYIGDADTTTFHTYHYYINGVNKTDSVYSRYTIAEGEWYFEGGWLYTHTHSGLLSTKRFFPSWNPGFADHYTRFTYDSLDNLIEAKRIIWDGSNYIEEWKTEYTRNERGHIKTATDYSEGIKESIFETKYNVNGFLSGINIYEIDASGDPRKTSRYDLIDSEEIDYDQLLVEEEEYFLADYNPGRINRADYMRIEETGLSTKVGELNFFWNDKTVGVNEKSTLDFTIYPNPSSDFISINMDNNSVVEYAITDATGRMYKSGRIPVGHKIDIGGLAKGVYQLRIDQGYKKGSLSFLKK
ncbi:T9SS type A sorting domain-containing protein [Luteibaculum oceani]|uniref:T9SS type A sorting domain-containing protein n=1 Tax=Luteibaculum oceani TaxID=1294296 RepID=A0A5C6UZ17_9FLAO|nr:T9SS type A sorting domain-containing protein [Luteibaculum oceani]TXC78517.1 T9SS type A sorting domain-containing protein [Luteibaculum oceani]